MELSAYCNLPRLHILNGDFKEAVKLLSDFNFVKEATKLGALYHLYQTAVLFQLDLPAKKLKKLLSRLSTIGKDTNSFAQFIIEEDLEDDLFEEFSPGKNGKLKKSKDFEHFLLAPRFRKPELNILYTKNIQKIIRVKGMVKL